MMTESCQGENNIVVKSYERGGLMRGYKMAG